MSKPKALVCICMVCNISLAMLQFYHVKFPSIGGLGGGFLKEAARWLPDSFFYRVNRIINPGLKSADYKSALATAIFYAYPVELGPVELGGFHAYHVERGGQCRWLIFYISSCNVAVTSFFISFPFWNVNLHRTSLAVIGGG